VESLVPRFFEFSAVCALIYWLGFCYRAASTPKTAIKTLSIGALAIGSLIAGTPIWLTLALAACALGDYFLSRDGAADFIKGVGAFAVGHLFYIILFLMDPLSDTSLITTNSRVATLSVLIVMSLIMMGILWFYAGKLRQAVLGYITIITAMGIAAATLPWQTNYDIVMLGVVFFIFSDLTLSMQLFLMTKGAWTSKVAPFLVWLFYWLAQMLITAGFVLRMVQS
jgi:uncharacterized membrane protein YhhN